MVWYLLPIVSVQLECADSVKNVLSLCLIIATHYYSSICDGCLQLKPLRESKVHGRTLWKLPWKVEYLHCNNWCVK